MQGIQVFQFDYYSNTILVKNEPGQEIGLSLAFVIINRAVMLRPNNCLNWLRPLPKRKLATRSGNMQPIKEPWDLYIIPLQNF